MQREVGVGGLPHDHVRHLHVTSFDLAGGGIEQTVLLGTQVDRLGLEEHDPDIPGTEVAALLQRRDQLLVVEVSVAEVPPQRRAGSGDPKPCSAKCRAMGRKRSWRA